jgi:hypothetical protein
MGHSPYPSAAAEPAKARPLSIGFAHGAAPHEP